ncbi:MAG: fold metallo-hydrolase [Flavipsychrobacter sp.]|jgi:L-ascorbate metabolism protein UlaG (beta-lactamase superfamily)|nr:fold metallo-hydrolase [Flavipsychrobacter sp.]
MQLLIILLAIVALFTITVYIFMKQAQFGAMPNGVRLQQIQQSKNYRDGQFQNLSNTPQLTEGATFFSVLKEFFFGSKERRKPLVTLPSKKTDLHKLDPNENVIIWFGHSSYFIQVDGKKILVDPVFSGNASPLKGTTRSFNGSDEYTVNDIPNIDYLFITHDHWDHLDYPTIKQLKPKVGKVITALGVGAHLERWGYDTTKVMEGDWHDELILDNGFKVNVTPARHFSGRGFKRNLALWVSFVLTTPTRKLYLGGDSGYDTHFAEIGVQYGPFDLAILENGQYNKSWKHIHMLPNEVVQAAIDLKANKLFPVHWGKFSLSLHSWDEPIKSVLAEAKNKSIPTLHPMIGEPMNLDNPGAQTEWWTNHH